MVEILFLTGNGCIQLKSLLPVYISSIQKGHAAAMMMPVGISQTFHHVISGLGFLI
jgi:hypothetical protein